MSITNHSSIPMLLCMEWVHAANFNDLRFFCASVETLMGLTRNPVVEWQSCITAHSQETDRTRQAAIFRDLQRLGVELGVSEVKIKVVTLWFLGRWGTYGACF
ncbi:hypothetical protein HOY80DRAFT_1050238 [Tuber brumale]|nr:hypothetical protein HOY80DRAFT_1050238 [Tuber brumale]